MRLINALCLISISFIVMAPSAASEDAAARGLQIAREVDSRDTGFGDQTASLVMELRNKQGDSSIREIRVKTLEVKGDGDKSMSIFDRPADVKGTAFLTYSHSTEPDDQWLYLPALKRVKRITSRNKSGPFMGSEFAYEDLSSQEIDKYRYKYLRDDTLDNKECFVIERIPNYEYSGYTRQEAWINKQHYRPEKIVFYDRKGSLLKTLTYSGYKKYLNKYWRADEMIMINHQTGKSTLLTWADYQFKVGLDESDFNRNSLKRAR